MSRTQRKCPDCGKPYRSWKLHKEGATKACVTNQTAKICMAQMEEAVRLGWTAVGHWHKVIEASEVPLRLVPSHWYDGGDEPGDSVVEKIWAPHWAMVIAKTRSVKAPRRAHAIRYLFEYVQRRRIFAAEIALLGGDPSAVSDAVVMLADEAESWSKI